jgi:hypothetical protein
MMSDLIQRQDAIEAVYEALRTPLPCYGNNLLQDSMTLAKAIVNNIPSAEPLEEFEWCHDCKEYDQEKHCCHRWTKVIRNTVEEIKTKYWRWVPVTEALPEEEVTVLVSAHYDGDKCYDYKANDYVTTAVYMDGRWFLSDEEHIMQLHKHHVIAWMPLPEPWKGE